MKYGVVRREDWKPAAEGYEDHSFCIAFLSDSGHVAVDQYANSDVPCGIGSVYTLDEPHIRRGVHLLPLELDVLGAFETEGEAIRYAIEIFSTYANDDEVSQAWVSNEIHRRRDEDIYIDNTISYQRGRRLLTVGIILGIIFLILFLLIVFARRTSNEVPVIPGFSSMLHGLWASIANRAAQ